MTHLYDYALHEIDVLDISVMTSVKEGKTS